MTYSALLQNAEYKKYCEKNDKVIKDLTNQATELVGSLEKISNLLTPERVQRINYPDEYTSESGELIIIAKPDPSNKDKFYFHFSKAIHTEQTVEIGFKYPVLEDSSFIYKEISFGKNAISITRDVLYNTNVCSSLRIKAFEIVFEKPRAQKWEDILPTVLKTMFELQHEKMKQPE